MATAEERLSRLDGGYEHLATKADTAVLGAQIGELKAEVRLLKWGMGLIVLLNIGMLAALIRLMDS